MKNLINGYEFVCKKFGLEFIEIVKAARKLNDNEYYALMVTDNAFNAETNPHLIGRDIRTGEYLIGLEKPSGYWGCYISKDYELRRNYKRRTTIIVKTDNPEIYYLL